MYDSEGLPSLKRYETDVTAAKSSLKKWNIDLLELSLNIVLVGLTTARWHTGNVS